MELGTARKMKKASAASSSRPLDKGKAKAASVAPFRPRPRLGKASSRSSHSEADSDEDDKATMLAALQAHGMAMFGLGGADPAESSTHARRRFSESISGGSECPVDDDEEVQGADFHSDDGWGAEDGFVSDSEEEEALGAAAQPIKAKTVVPEVVFAPTAASAPAVVSKAERKAFMNGNSAKIMGLQREIYNASNPNKRARDASEELEDQSNLKLDKTLHDMLLTTLLPSAAADSASRPVDKRNAMSGRLMELASYALPGEGAAGVADVKHSKHSAKIRTGILQKKAKREEKARAEAEAAGSWVRGIGGLGDGGRKGADGSGKSTMRARLGEDLGKKKGMEGTKGKVQRDRGLGIGIGKFKGGMLMLSEREIARGSDEARGFRGKKRRGGRR